MDAILKFPDEQTAVQFGFSMGYTDIPEEGTPSTCLASHQHAIHIIGEHFVPTGETITDDFGTRPVMAGDGKWWVLFRCPHDLPMTPELEPFVVWASFFVDEDGAPLPRPVDPTIPSVFWS